MARGEIDRNTWKLIEWAAIHEVANLSIQKHFSMMSPMGMIELIFVMLDYENNLYY